MFRTLASLRAHLSREEAWNLREWVCQRYVSRPLLPTAAGWRRKFHVRVYALAVGAHPMRVFVHRDMLALFASRPYPRDPSDVSDSLAHLTNTCRQGAAVGESTTLGDAGQWRGDGGSGGEEEVVRLLEETAALFPADPSMAARLSRAREQIACLVGETFEAVSAELNFMPLAGCFELFGLDVLLDHACDPWLLEANAEPDFMQTGGRLGGIIDDVLYGAFELAVQGRAWEEAEGAGGWDANGWREVFVKTVAGSQGSRFAIA